MNKEFDPVQEEIQATINAAIAKAGSAPAAAPDISFKPSQLSIPRTGRALLPNINIDMPADTIATDNTAATQDPGRVKKQKRARDYAIAASKGASELKSEIAKDRKAFLADPNARNIIGSDDDAAVMAWATGKSDASIPTRALRAGANLIGGIGSGLATAIGVPLYNAYTALNHTDYVPANKSVPPKLERVGPGYASLSDAVALPYQAYGERNDENLVAGALKDYMPKTSLATDISDAAKGIVAGGVSGAVHGLANSILTPQDMFWNMAGAAIPNPIGKLAGKGASLGRKAAVGLGGAAVEGGAYGVAQPLLERGNATATDAVVGGAMNMPFAALNVTSALRKQKKSPVKLDAGYIPDMTSADWAGKPTGASEAIFGKAAQDVAPETTAAAVTPLSKEADNLLSTSLATAEDGSQYVDLTHKNFTDRLNKNPNDPVVQEAINHLNATNPAAVADLLDRAAKKTEAKKSVYAGAHDVKPHEVLAEDAKAAQSAQSTQAATTAAPLTKAQEAAVKRAQENYIKDGEDLSGFTVKQIADRSRHNNKLHDMGLLPEDAHPAFSRQGDAMLETNRIKNERTEAEGKVAVNNAETQKIKADNDIIDAGEAVVDLHFDTPEGRSLLGGKNLDAIVAALKVDKDRGGNFRAKLEAQLAPEQVDKLIKASKLPDPASRRSNMLGAITGETPSEAAARLAESERVATENKGVDAEIDDALAERTKADAEAETARKKVEADLEKQNKADKIAHDASEDAREETESAKKNFISGINKIVEQKDLTGKTTKEKAKITEQQSQSATSAAKSLASNEAFADEVLAKLPEGPLRNELEGYLNLVLNIKNPPSGEIANIAKFLTANASRFKEAGEQPRFSRVPFSKKALPSP